MKFDIKKNLLILFFLYLYLNDTKIYETMIQFVLKQQMAWFT